MYPNTKRDVGRSRVIFKETTWYMGLGAGGRMRGCKVCGCLIALLSLREEMGKAGAGDSAT